MGKVRIKRGIFVGILGILFLLLGIQQVRAEETEQLCYCTCSPIEVEEVEGDQQEPETQNFASQEEEVILGEIQEEEIETQNVASQEDPIILDYSSANIILNEIYPAPLSGETEFIELYNAGAEQVNLDSWYLMDESGKKYIIQDVELQAGAYTFFNNDTTRIALNNGGDTVYLYDPLDNLRHSLVYPGVEKGDSLINNNGNWEISLSPSPGSENIIDNDVDVETQSRIEPGMTASPEEIVIKADNDALEDIETQNSVFQQDDVSQSEIVIEANNDAIEILEADENVLEQVQDDSTEEGIQENVEDIIIYENQGILSYKDWADDSLIKITGQIISPAGAWINNRCFIAKGKQAIPVLCTALAGDFKFGEIVDLSGKVSFKNGSFYRFDPDLLSSSSEEINLDGDIISENLENYKIYKYQGLVTDFSEKYHKLSLETEGVGDFVLRWPKTDDWDLPVEGDLITGLAMVDAKGQLWLWKKWEIILLDGEQVVEIENSSESDENNTSEEIPEVPAAVLGIGAVGALGTGKVVWAYRKILRKVFARK